MYVKGNVKVALLTIIALLLVQCLPGSNSPASAAISSLPDQGSLRGPNPGSSSEAETSASPATNLPVRDVPDTTTYYVSINGNGTDGRSWATAWQSFNQINWPGIQPGDSIMLDGGTSQMTYTSTLTIGASGTSAAPITIAMSTEPGHNGQVVIFGGRSIPLPYCDQQTYTYQTVGVRLRGVEFGSSSWVVLDGTRWGGIVITGHNEFGIHLDSSSSHVTVRNVEIYDNGNAAIHTPTNAWRPDQPGVGLSGSYNTFERDIIHDNGQDGFQSSGGISNFTIRQSWIYNSRPHPTANIGLASNFCMHSDGIQVYGGGNQSGVLIDGSILGPGLMQGTILGQAPSQAQVDNVTVNNSLIIDTTNANIMGYPTVQSQNWQLLHVTSFHVLYDPDAGSHSAFFLEGAGHQIRDSIAYGGDIYLPNGAQTSGNFQYHTTGYNLGTNADPLFVNAPAYNSTPDLQTLINSDYSLQSGSPAAGKGSSVTSVAQLLGQPPTSPTPTSPPAATSTRTPIRTSTPTTVPGSTMTPLPATDTPTQSPVPTSTPQGFTPTRTDTPTLTATWVPGVTPSPVPPSATPTRTSTALPESTVTPPTPPLPTATSTQQEPQPTATRTPSSTATTIGTPPATPPSTPVPTEPPASTATPCALHFEDVPPTHTFYPFVRCLACRGYVSGYPCGGPGAPCNGNSDPYFRPNNPITRGQIAKIVSNAAGFADGIPADQQTFEDVPPNSTFWLFVERLSLQHVMGGYPCGGAGEPCVPPQNRAYFRPSNNATRGQIAKIVSNAAGFSDPPAEQTFVDVTPGSTFYDFIERLASRGVMNGYPCSGPGEPCEPPSNKPYFRPSNSATRGQLSKIASNTFFPDCSVR